MPTSSLEPLARKDPPNPNPSNNPNQPPDHCDQNPACGWAYREDGSFDGWDCYCPVPSPQHDRNAVRDGGGGGGKRRRVTHDDCFQDGVLDELFQGNGAAQSASP